MFQYLVVRSDTKLVQQLDDNHYNSKDLVEIKIPLNSPYITNTKGYERYDGSIELKGVQYNFVKRKIYNDVTNKHVSGKNTPFFYNDSCEKYNL